MNRPRSCSYVPCLLLVHVFLFTVTPPAVAANDLAGHIEAVIDGPAYRHGRWGILVVDADSGETIYEREADRLFIPASTTKLYTCAAALLGLGPDYRFETPVYRRGEVTDGRLRGDLILVAQGDLAFGGRTGPDGRLAFRDHDHTYANGNNDGEVTDTDPLAGLKDLAKQVAATGVRHIDGEVLVDDRLFAKNRSTGSGPDLLTPILVNDNLVDVLITPATEPGKPASVRLRPETGFIQADVQVLTGEEKSQTRVEIEPVGPQRFKVRGRIALQARPLLRVYYVDDPTAFARALFIEALQREGIIVRASPLQTPRTELPDQESYGRLPRVAVYRSPPLAEAVKVTLKVSHNLYASTLPLLLAAKNGKRTLVDGLQIGRGHLEKLGVDVGAVSFAGGAGGANADSVTPRATVQLLRALAKRPEWAAYREGLPVLGVDGTLADVVGPESPARGKVRAKTGTLYWYDALNDRSLLRSKALAGVMTTASGRELCFALFVNDVPLPKGVQPSREGKVLGRLCELLYEHAR